jgi:uncharacterized protein (TIGR04255 family)
VVIRDYDCWGTTLPLLLDVFTRIGSVYLSEVPAIKSVTVQYLNEFRARTTEVQEAREIFRQGSNWLAPFYIDAKDFWHSHAGIYEPISDNSRFLLNFNADVVSQAFLGESEARLYAKALILSAIHFDILGQSPWVVEENAFLSGLSDRLNDVHRREKQLLAEVISDSYLAVMGEGADEYSRSK